MARYGNRKPAKWNFAGATEGVEYQTTDEGDTSAEVVHVRQYVWNSGTMSWDKATAAAGASNTEYTEDNVAVANPIGIVPVFVRLDTPAALVSADGDIVAGRATNYGAQYVQIVSSSGSFVDSFGGGTQYTEDAAAAADPVGTTPVFVRKDTPAAITSTDGDVIAARATNYGAQYVQIVNSSGNFIDSFGGSGGTSAVDDSAFTIATDSVTPAGFLADETTPDSVDEGDVGLARMTLDRKILTRVVGASDANRLDVDASGHAQVDIAADSVGLATSANQLPDGHNVTVDNAAGASAVNIQDGGNTITVDGTVTADAGTGHPTVYTEDAASAGGETGLVVLGVRQDADTSPVSLTGDYHTLVFNSAGALKVEAFDSGDSFTVDGTVTANAGSGPWPVTDNAGSLTVDAPVGTPVNVQVGDGTNTAAIHNLAANDALSVAIVDGSGTQITSFGGGTQYTEDDAAAANPVGTAPIFVRSDTPAALVSLDGDNVAGRATNYGAQYVQVVNSSGNFIDSFGGSGGTSSVDDSAFTIATDSVTPAGFLADETTPDSVDEGDVGLARMTLDRKVLTRIVGATDANRLDVDASGHAQVDIAADSVGLATSANQLPDGHNVTIDNAAGASAVNIQDGGNTITVDGAVTVSGTVTGAPSATTVTGTGAAVDATPIASTDAWLYGSVHVWISGTFTATYAFEQSHDNSTWDSCLAYASDQISASIPSSAGTSNVMWHIKLGARYFRVRISAYTSGTVNASAVFKSHSEVDPVIYRTNFAYINTNAVSTGQGVADGGTQRVSIATNDSLNTELPAAAALDDATSNPTVPGVGGFNHVFNGTTWDRIRGSTTGLQAIGGLAHDAADTAANNPVKVGYRAIAHGTNPTAVAAADVTHGYANRAGIPFVIGGHPNIVTLRANYTTAQTNAAIVTVSTGSKIVVTRCSVTADNANTVDTQVRIGFATATTPTTTGVVLSHPGIAAGSGVVEGTGAGILGVGADDEDLRITSEVPTGGSIDVVVSYYTIES